MEELPVGDGDDGVRGPENLSCSPRRDGEEEEDEEEEEEEEKEEQKKRKVSRWWLRGRKDGKCGWISEPCLFCLL